MEAPDPIANATALVESLDSLTIRQRLERLDSEEQALKVLLRAAVARERGGGPHRESRGAVAR